MLLEWEGGDASALDRLLPAVYDDLRRRAGSLFRRERPGHTLQPTALVHEAFVRLVDQRRVQWQNRAQFYGVAAQAMRRVLVDHARRRGAAKRGASAMVFPFDEELVPGRAPNVDVLALDQALRQLAELDARQSRIVELRHFGGLTIEETAEVLRVSRTTVKNEWKMARAWLYNRLKGAGGPEAGGGDGS